MVKIKHTPVEKLPSPPKTVLTKYHRDNSQEFTAPEYRNITILRVRPEDIADEIDVPEERIRDEYDSRLSEFSQDEKRRIQQILVSNKELVEKINSRLNSGDDFIAVASELANLNAENVELGNLMKKELPVKELADAAFLLNSGANSIPIRSSLGWHILRVTEITQASRQPIEEVREKLRKSIQLDMAVDALVPIANQLEPLTLVDTHHPRHQYLN